jgi:16S rRNA (uracil1498-N3)-methyltransferase
MSSHLFFTENLEDSTVRLDEETSKHLVGVLRMKKGDEILLTDGKGKKAKAIITDDNRKKSEVHISSVAEEEQTEPKIAIGISIIKNSARFEWFLEKATEIGVHEIIPLLCQRTEKEKFRFERMQNILVSAMLQSQQSWMPVLHQPTEFQKVLELTFEQKLVAHCMDTKRQQLTNQLVRGSNSILILIGPEGDFTGEEIKLALGKAFIPATLGTTRLRTETAGIVAATLLKNYSGNN